jgi:hypothetical protein
MQRSCAAARRGSSASACVAEGRDKAQGPQSRGISYVAKQYVMLLCDYWCVVPVNFHQFVHAWHADGLPWAGGRQQAERSLLIVKPKTKERYRPRFPDEARLPAARAISSELVHAGSLGAGTTAGSETSGFESGSPESATPLSMTCVIQSFLTT